MAKAKANAKTSEVKFGVHSEVGQLRKVMVCAPGLAHSRLTPSNCDQLLFDDVLWVENAKRDHFDFVMKMRDRGIEVVEMHNLLAETVAVPEGKKWILDNQVVPNQVGLGFIAELRSYLEGLDNRTLAETLIGGLSTLDFPESAGGKALKVVKEAAGATEYLLMPAKGVFALGVGHVRRKTLEPGDKADEPAAMMTTTAVDLTCEEWEVLLALKEELTLEEVVENPWLGRAADAGVSLERFCEVAESLNAKKVIGRFSTFLEHVKPSSTGERVTRFNGLFHWAVPKGREIQAGAEVGRHFCMTHCYWREGGPQFRDVNIMGVVHGTEKDRVLEHKVAIDRHLAAIGMPVAYTNVFWGGRSEIKPSEISPKAYAAWHEQQGG